MKYRLKDKELQKKLDNISGGDFSVQLQKVSDDILSSLTGPGVHFGGLARVIDDRFRNLAPRFTFRFHKDEVEEVPEFNSHQWNLYPEVLPPQGAMMRIKYHDATSEDRKVERGFAIFDCGQWVNDSGYPKFPNNPQNYRIWFRPWIGPDEEGEE